ncbi:MAG: hypothetical protein IIZ48_01950, partial [Erysipelotrichales bacterium]|nr:hypothetical protein [Erysipelotrichales bacterium]
ASFYADFQRAVGGGQINSVYDKGIIVTGGTFSDDSLYIVRSNATSSLPAQAQLYFTGTAVNGFGMATFYLRLFVPYNGPAYARFSILN